MQIEWAWLVQKASKKGLGGLPFYIHTPRLIIQWSTAYLPSGQLYSKVRKPIETPSISNSRVLLYVYVMGLLI